VRRTGSTAKLCRRGARYPGLQLDPLGAAGHPSTTRSPRSPVDGSAAF